MDLNSIFNNLGESAKEIGTDKVLNTLATSNIINTDNVKKVIDLLKNFNIGAKIPEVDKVLNELDSEENIKNATEKINNFFKTVLKDEKVKKAIAPLLPKLLSALGTK